MLLLRIPNPSDFWSLVCDLIFLYENLYNLLFVLTFLKFYYAESVSVSIFINSPGHLVSLFNLKLMSFSSWKFTWIILLIIFSHLFSWKSYYLDVGSFDIVIVSLKILSISFLFAHFLCHFKTYLPIILLSFFVSAMYFQFPKVPFYFIVLFCPESKADRKSVV